MQESQETKEPTGGLGLVGGADDLYFDKDVHFSQISSQQLIAPAPSASPAAAGAVAPTPPVVEPWDDDEFVKAVIKRCDDLGAGPGPAVKPSTPPSSTGTQQQAVVGEYGSHNYRQIKAKVRESLTHMYGYMYGSRR